MIDRDRQETLQIDNTYRRMSLQQEIPAKKQRFHNVGTLRLKISILCLSTFYWGYCLAYLSTLSTQTMIQQFGAQSQNSTIKGFLIGVLTLGGAAGAFSSPFWMKCFTRRNLILLFNIGALMIEGVIQYPNLYCLFVCRAFQGYFVGNFMALVPVYINELSPKQIVRIFGVYTQLFAMFGVVVAFAIGIILTKAGVQNQIIWRVMFGLDILTISFVIINCILGVIPQSPNSLIMKGQKQQAKKVINMFVKDEYVQEVFKQKMLQVQHQKSLSSNKSQQVLNYSKKAYFIGFLLPLMQQLTGINAIVTQIGGIVSKHNADFGYYLPLIINFVQFAATFGAITALNLFGRKTILLAGNIGLGICDILLGILFVFINKFPAAFWIVFAILMIYMAIYSTTIGPVVWMYVPQIIPAKIVPFATTLNWLGCSFCLIILPIINESLGSSAVFFIFGGLTLFIGVINIFGIVQTKGLNLKQICAAYQ